MSDTPTCAATTRDGSPCHARPVPGSEFCPFHHPDHAAAFTDGRGKGGAAPRRRIRRLPVILDHMHVAELMSELLVDAMNHPETVDSGRLHALTGVSRVILRAVGTPRRSFLVHQDRVDTPARIPHLLRIYAPDSAKVADLLALEEEVAEESDSAPPPPSDAPPAPEPPDYQSSGIFIDAGLKVQGVDEYLEDARVLHPDSVPVDPREADPPPYADVRFPEPYTVPPCTDDPPACEPDLVQSATADFAGTDRDFNPGELNPEQQAEHQAPDKSWTSDSAVENISPEPPPAKPEREPAPAARPHHGLLVGALAGEPYSTIHPSLREPLRLWPPRLDW